MKIKVREITKGCKFEIIEKGDWIDLRAAQDIEVQASQAGVRKRKKVGLEEISTRDVESKVVMIPLGIAMQLPKGFEAHVLPRSSTPKKFGIMCANSQGIIDCTYCGNDDEWKFPVVPIRNTRINKGDRICQFRIQLSQKATMWQKIKWLFTSKIKFVWVDKLEGENRGGFGSTGVK